MTVKQKRGRRRYIAFDVPVGLTAPAMAQGLPRGFRVIQCSGGMAVIRCAPGETEECIVAVTERFSGSAPRRTSGTLRALRSRYSVLREGKPAKPHRRKSSRPPV